MEVYRACALLDSFHGIFYLKEVPIRREYGEGYRDRSLGQPSMMLDGEQEVIYRDHKT
jgi:hypothetical protein